MMKKIVLFSLLSVMVPCVGLADEVTRKAQAELKTQGFYYGEVTGELSAETASAIKRFQIRNGLEVTGTLTRESLESLGMVSSRVAPAPATRTPLPPPATSKVVPPEPRSERFSPADDTEYTDRARETPEVVPPSGTRVPGGEYAEVFMRTPFATAPRQVQEVTVRRAQSFLSTRGHYRDAIDGLPSPELEEALLSYQRRARLPLSGRLDLDTLSQMRLLPGRSPLRAPNAIPQNEPRKSYRGIWID